MDLKLSDTLRYLGYNNTLPDDNMLEEINFLMSELSSSCTPKFTYKTLKINICNDEIDFDFFKCKSKFLANHIDDCDEAIIFAATLGTEADFLIRRYSKISLTKSVIINACASALIEDFANDATKSIADTFNDKYLRPRFSPGYHDFNLSHQKDIINLLNTNKNIGLTLSNNLILMPTKSITAIIGLSNTYKPCMDGCSVCTNKNCEFRRI